MSGQSGNERHTQSGERLERAVSCPGPVAPHFERRQAAPGGNVTPSAKRLALAREDRNSRLRRGVDSARRLGEPIDHRAIQCVQLVGALQGQARERPLEREVNERAHGAISSAGRSLRSIGAAWKSAGSILRRSLATLSGNSAWARTSCSVSTPGAISVTVTPSGASRSTQRSVT